MSDGYITDIPYINGFYENLCPLSIRQAAIINRTASPRTSEPFRYLELGCGLGESLATLAAANPIGEFVGIDVNPSHVADAAGKISAGKITNAKVIEASFSNVDASIGDFDFICLHGVWSWVSAKVREDILSIIQHRLKPGGMAVVSYNAMPGWSHLQPIRDMIRHHSSQGDGDTFERLSESLAYVKMLRDNNAAYFAANPRASQSVETLLRHDPRYVAHEYLNEFWEPLYFREVAGEFSSRGLTYVGSLPLYSNLWNLFIGETLLKPLSATRDRVAAETHKDYCVNTGFRWDVYTKDAALLSGYEERVANSSDIYYTTAKRYVGVPFLPQIGGVQVPLGGPIVEALVDCLSEKSDTAGGIIKAASYTGAKEIDICNTIDACVACGMLVASHKPLPLKEVDLSKPISVVSDFNKSIVESPAADGREATLASEYTGNGHTVGSFDRLIIAEACKSIGEESITRGVSERLKGVTVTSGGVAVDSQADRDHIARKKVTEFLRKGVHAYSRMGIISQPKK